MGKYKRIMPLDLSQLMPHRKDDKIKVIAENELASIRIKLDLNSLEGTIDKDGVCLEKQSCHYGGYRYWFLCPCCSKRKRVLMWLDGEVKCRECGELLYFSQKHTKTDCAYPFTKAVQIAREVDPNYNEEVQFYQRLYQFPERPKYMRQTKYDKKKREFMKWVKKGMDVWLEDVARNFPMR